MQYTYMELNTSERKQQLNVQMELRYRHCASGLDGPEPAQALCNLSTPSPDWSSETSSMISPRL